LASTVRAGTRGSEGNPTKGSPGVFTRRCDDAALVVGDEAPGGVEGHLHVDIDVSVDGRPGVPLHRVVEVAAVARPGRGRAAPLRGQDERRHRPVTVLAGHDAGRLHPQRDVPLVGVVAARLLHELPDGNVGEAQVPLDARGPVVLEERERRPVDVPREVCAQQARDVGRGRGRARARRRQRESRGRHGAGHGRDGGSRRRGGLPGRTCRARARRRCGRDEAGQASDFGKEERQDGIDPSAYPDPRAARFNHRRRRAFIAARLSALRTRPPTR
jgi:hypothetical protein